ncbi:MAG: hypothetical protein JWQ40_5078 [Segetibacter sp.]|jgi:hypothetical protein|nr:hypothetical protein [Segetibacter sp.]
MYKQVSLILCCILFNFWCNGQISINLQLPPTGIVMKNQLWNIAVVNSGSSAQEVYIGLTLLNASDNQPVLTATTKVITVNKGAFLLKSTDLNPIQYHYISPINNVDQTPNGFLPIGNFMACFTVYKHEYETYIELAEDCVPVEVAPLSPPLLNTPENEAVIETPFPLFSWIPPVPINLFNELSYDLILVEVLQGQEASQAIQQNVPVYNIGNYRSLFNNYPASNKSLDTAKTYAWRIVARNNNQFAAQSEVWTFKLRSKQPDSAKIDDQPYIKLKRGYESATAVSKGILKIEYDNQANDSVLNYTIRSSESGENEVLKEGTLNLQYGPNLIEIELLKGRKFSINKTYQFQIVNSRNEEWNLKFSYNTPATAE